MKSAEAHIITIRSATLDSMLDGSPDWVPCTPRVRAVAMHFPHDNQGQMQPHLRASALCVSLAQEQILRGNRQNPPEGIQNVSKFLEGSAPGFEALTLLGLNWAGKNPMHVLSFSGT